MESFVSSGDDSSCTSDLEDRLQQLFAGENGLESSSEESPSDKEWREALRATVETEIQYQVQLRLASSPVDREEKRDSDTPPDVQKLDLRLKTKRKLKPSTETEMKLDTNISPRSTAMEEKQDVLNENETLKSLNSKHRHHNERKENYQTVYEYVSNKYGTPIDQLQHLLSNGKYKCDSLDDETRSKLGIDRRVRWPVECKISQPTPAHSTSQLHHQIPLGVVTGPVLGHKRPKPQRASGPMTILYDRCAAADEPKGEMTNCLKFESQFESGNLNQAIHVGPYEYDLLLNTDLYTERHTQWFYFKVSNMESGTTYKFNIINFRKKNSLYNFGMKILMYSETDGSWQRVGYDVCYRKLDSHYSCPLLKQGTEYYYLSWKMEFTHDKDVCYFSHCFPYTFSHLLKFIDSLQENEKTKKHIRKETLCDTLAGNPCPLITITDFDTAEDHQSKRMGVVFTARVHPGETNSSWMMNGVLEYLTSDHKHAKYLRSHFVFKIVPMLNPDGVIVGNYRTSLAGVDLNRIYKNPIEKLFPTVYNLKKLVQSFMDERRIALYVDLHGHSRNYNIFMYGCRTPQCDHAQFLQERVVPWLLSQISKEKFSFKACKFAVQRCKESTGRVTLWRTGVANSFTMEASFCGTDLTKPFPVHFTQQDLMSSGKDLCDLLLKLQRYYKSASYQYKIHCRIAEFYMQQIKDEQNCDSVLPDIVATTLTEETSAERKRKMRHRMAKSLQAFHGISMRMLEKESSTSGSDSENDEFKYKQKQKLRQKRQKQKKLTLPSQTHVSQPKLTPTSTTSNKETAVDPAAHQDINDEESIRTKKHSPLQQAKPVARDSKEGVKHSNSAPPRLQRGSHPLNSWRFINKYSNRSNGGIPMFSEERLKERLEKQRMKSQSMVQDTPISKLPSIVYSGETEESTLPQINSTIPSLSAHTQVTWDPIHSQHFPSIPKPTEISAGLPRGKRRLKHSSSTSSDWFIQSTKSLSHYQHVKELVESRRMASRPVPHPQLQVTGHPHRLTNGLPPELSQYINEIWQKHVGNTRGRF